MPLQARGGGLPLRITVTIPAGEGSDFGEATLYILPGLGARRLPTIVAMALRRRLNQLDARLGFAPGENEPWLAFVARKNPQNPYLAALREAGARIGALEERVAALEARDK